MKNDKISASLKRHFAENGHHMTGKPGIKHSAETKDKISRGVQQSLIGKPKKTENEKKARNKANVYAYRARKRNAIPDNANLELIRKIYEACPPGYHVDHIKALAVGGLHHEDNLQYLPENENRRKSHNRDYDKTLIIRWQDLVH